MSPTFLVSSKWLFHRFKCHHRKSRFQENFRRPPPQKNEGGGIFQPNHVFKNFWHILEQFFFLTGFCPRKVYLKGLEKKFVKNSATVQQCHSAKRPLYRLSHNHCPDCHHLDTSCLSTAWDLMSWGFWLLRHHEALLFSRQMSGRLPRDQRHPVQPGPDAVRLRRRGLRAVAASVLGPTGSGETGTASQEVGQFEFAVSGTRSGWSFDRARVLRHWKVSHVLAFSRILSLRRHQLRRCFMVV